MVNPQSISSTRIQRAPGAQDAYRISPIFGGLGFVESTHGQYQFPLHRHPDYQVILVTTGEYRVRLNDREFMLGANEGLVVKPGDMHQDFCEPPLRYIAIGFKLNEEPRQAPSLFAPAVQEDAQCFILDQSLVQPLIQQIDAESRNPDAISAHLQDALLLQFFWHLVRALPSDALSTEFLDLSREQAFPNQVRLIFERHLHRHLTVAEMADELGMSESSFAHRCTATLGVSPSKAFAAMKMQHAASLLRNTEMLVKEIATRIGYGDPFTFSRAFKNHFGDSPSSCRR